MHAYSPACYSSLQVPVCMLAKGLHMEMEMNKEKDVDRDMWKETERDMDTSTDKGIEHMGHHDRRESQV